MTKTRIFLFLTGLLMVGSGLWGAQALGGAGNALLRRDTATGEGIYHFAQTDAEGTPIPTSTPNTTPGPSPTPVPAGTVIGDIRMKPWDSAGDLTVTATSAWTAISLSTTAGDSSTTATYRIFFENKGANTMNWQCNTYTVATLVGGFALSLSKTVQINDLSYKHKFWYQTDSSTTGHLYIEKR